MLSEEIENCTALLDQQLTPQINTSTYPTTWCVYDTETTEWKSGKNF
jgi:hypothetical protein